MINTGNDVNSVTLIGNLMCDVDWKNDRNGAKCVGFFALGTTRKEKGEFVTDRHSVVIKGPTIAFFPNVKKGDKVFIQGTLTYTKKSDSPCRDAEILLEVIKPLEVKSNEVME